VILIRKLLTSAIVLGIGGVVISQYPDIKRYLKMKRM
jgi:hypothetical protein